MPKPIWTGFRESLEFAPLVNGAEGSRVRTDGSIQRGFPRWVSRFHSERSGD